jgi:hypothetical protein
MLNVGNSRKGLPGKTTGSVRRARTLEHLNPRSVQHATDHAYFAQRNASIASASEVRTLTEKLGWKIVPPGGPNEGIIGRNQSGSCADLHIASGSLYLPSGEEISGQEFEALCADEHDARCRHKSPRRRAGKTTMRWARTVPLRYDTITSRPDYHLALRRLFDSGLDPRAFFASYMPRLAEDFAAASSYELIAVAAHLAEGNVHMHPVYSVVDRSGNLLHLKTAGRGRRGTNRLGPANVGTIRLAEEGFVPEKFAAIARQALERSRDQHGGQDPLDLRLARSWDAHLSELSRMPEFQPTFARARADYEQELAERNHLVDHDELKVHVSTVETERDAATARLAESNARCGVYAKWLDEAEAERDAALVRTADVESRLAKREAVIAELEAQLATAVRTRFADSAPLTVDQRRAQSAFASIRAVDLEVGGHAR